ncbi:MAG TPA: Ig-like domain-containing protein [Longimicrobium sp.]
MVRRHAIPFAVLFAALLSCDSPTGSGPKPAQVLAASGTPQTAATEDPLPNYLVVQVTDRTGQAVPGVAVAWTVDEGGGTLSAATSTTDDAGMARVQWTLGAGIGTFTARATVQGLGPATFTATAVWPQPAQVQVVGGNGQNGGPARLLADSLAVKVVSAKGRPVPQATVAWSVSGGGGTLSAATAVTNAAGVAKVAWTLGAAGPNAATATVGSLTPAGFAAYAVPVASVTLSSADVRVGRGDAVKLVATPRDSTGTPLAGRAIVWTTSSAATASVSDSGTVTGQALGTATVIATSEGRSATAQVTVTTEDRTPPRLVGLSFSPGQVDVTSAAATVQFSVHARDAGSGVSFFAVGFRGPSQGSGASCQGPHSGDGVLASGTPHDGVWTCRATIPKGATAGTWTVGQVNLVDAYNQDVFSTAELQAAGYPVALTVVNSGPPATPPALTGLSFSPDPVNVGASNGVVQVAFTATASAGVHRAYVFVEPTRGEAVGVVDRSCAATTRVSGTSTAGTWTCSITIPRNAPGGTWRINTLSVTDSAGNATQYSVAELAARGLPGSFQVTSPNEDVTAPALTGVTVSPAAVNLANGATYVQVTMRVTDAGVGASHGTAGLTPLSGGGYGCSGNTPGEVGQQNATIVCAIPFKAGATEGTWKLNVFVMDAVGNSRQYGWEQLRAAGLPYEVTVTH